MDARNQGRLANRSDLVLRVQEGDEIAFEQLIRLTYDRLFATAHRILRNRDDAEDAVQDAIVRCWRDIRALRDPDRFDAWLYRLLINASRDQMRRRKRALRDSAQLSPYLPATGDDYAALMNQDALERAFRSLGADQRIVLVLAHYVGYPAPEIATILGVPTGTVYSRLHYATRAMQAALTTARSTSAITMESTL